MSPDAASTLESPLRAWSASVCAGIAGLGLLSLRPDLEQDLFAQGAARVAGFLTGAPVFPVDGGWQLPLAGGPVVVTADCSGTDFFLLGAVLMTRLLLRRGARVWLAVPGGLFAAVPFTLGVNGLRVVAVLQLHHWVLPHLPPVYGPFLHLVVGTAVFLPCLILLHLASEHHARPRFSRPHSR
ncbi:MAG TPA: exosortase/archaeosortase family protein [Opitutaceae bacterium]|nr:exosortase/archaeosortase family protein [Opitutaceae bacterium]